MAKIKISLPETHITVACNCIKGNIFTGNCSKETNACLKYRLIIPFFFLLSLISFHLRLSHKITIVVQCKSEQESLSRPLNRWLLTEINKNTNKT
ncbi:hypothetical protein HZS_5413 [Henneguya salminicola]|nr:hypothetical protein HZS_5413 [Henneguya salminicola]